MLEDIILARNCSWPFDYNSRWSGTTTTRGPEATPSTCSTPSPTRDPVLPLLQRWFSNFLHFMADEKETNKEHLPKCMMYSVYCTYVLVSTTNIRIIQEKTKTKIQKLQQKHLARCMSCCLLTSAGFQPQMWDNNNMIIPVKINIIIIAVKISIIIIACIIIINCRLRVTKV